MAIAEEMHKGERILKELTPSRWAYFWWYFIGILFIWVFGLGLFVIVIAELIRRGNKYYITGERVLHQFIFLSKKTSSTIYNRIQDLHLTQSFIERIVGIGTIHINTAGTHFVEIKFVGVNNPVSVKRLIEEKMIKKKGRKSSL